MRTVTRSSVDGAIRFPYRGYEPGFNRPHESFNTDDDPGHFETGRLCHVMNREVGATSARPGGFWVRRLSQVQRERRLLEHEGKWPHIHGAILPTPDSVPGKSDDYTDNIAYMDKLVGKLRAELDRLNIREKTLIVFFGNNGTVGGRSKSATIGGKTVSGAKGSMLEGGSLVPSVANWPSTTTAGIVSELRREFLAYFVSLPIPFAVLSNKGGDNLVLA